MVQSFNFSGIANAFRVLWSPGLAMPHIIVDDIRQIHFANLKKYAKIKAIGFDKDNCLTAPYVSTINPPFKEAWKECKDTFSDKNVVIVSNSAGTNDDIDYKDKYTAEHLEKNLGAVVLRHKEKKPSGGDEFAKHLAPISKEETAFVGDRILTDIIFGNRNGNLTIWTKTVVTEEGDNKVALVLRRMEHRLINFLQKMNVKAPPHTAFDSQKNNIFTK